MTLFNKILYTSQGKKFEANSLKQILMLAKANQAHVDIFITFPVFPKKLAHYQQTLEDTLRKEIEQTIQTATPELQQKVQIVLESTDKPANAMLKHINQNKHDLVLKQAPPQGSGSGFEPVDLTLLRKSPSPILLYRKPIHEISTPKLVVAIDAESPETSGNVLAKKLLVAADFLAELLNADLTILSCWDYEFQNYLKNNAFIHIAEDEVLQVVLDSKNDHQQALSTLIKDSGIASTHTVKAIRGKAEEVIPAYLIDHQIDILLMGTAARSGLQGFFIGNTAEHILHKIPCSLLAMQPPQA